MSGQHNTIGVRAWSGLVSLHFSTGGLSRRKWSPRPTMTIIVAIDGPPDQVWQTMTATDGLTLPQVVSLYFSMLHAINVS